MWYEINVSHNGKHFFATDKRSITSPSEAKVAWDIFKKKFPESQGYKLTMSRNETTGYDVTADYNGTR